MRIASRNRFGRLVIKRVWYNNTGTTLKQHISIAKSNQTVKDLKPANGIILSYDFPASNSTGR